MRLWAFGDISTLSACGRLTYHMRFSDFHLQPFSVANRKGRGRGHCVASARVALRPRGLGRGSVDRALGCVISKAPPAIAPGTTVSHFISFISAPGPESESDLDQLQSNFTGNACAATSQVPLAGPRSFPLAAAVPLGLQPHLRLRGVCLKGGGWEAHHSQ